MNYEHAKAYILERCDTYAEDGHWIWEMNITDRNTMPVRYNGQPTTARRLAWEAFKQGKPRGQIRASCNEPLCVNPDHMYDSADRTGYYSLEARKRIRLKRAIQSVETFIIGPNNAVDDESWQYIKRRLQEDELV